MGDGDRLRRSLDFDLERRTLSLRSLDLSLRSRPPRSLDLDLIKISTRFITESLQLLTYQNVEY